MNLSSDYRLLADSAFPKIGAVGTRLLSPVKDGLLLLNAKICSLKPAAEWGSGNL